MRVARMFGYGMLGVILVLYLIETGLDTTSIGLLITFTLVGDSILSLVLSVRADRWGRRRTLLAGAILMSIGGAGMALSSDFVWLLVAATIGVISPTGNEVGPFLAVEQAGLAQVAGDKERTRFFAWYNFAGYIATAFGALFGGALAELLQHGGVVALESFRTLFWIYAILGLLIGLVSLCLGKGIEAPASAAVLAPKSLLGLAESRPVVLKLGALFSLDSFAGGFIVQSFIVYWFHQKFGVGEAALGSVFFGTNILAGVSALAAVPLTRRFGLVNTMVWTHLPSNILLILVPLMPTFGMAVFMLLLRHAISQMDVPVRQSYVNAVVPAGERSAANGVTGTAKQLGAALAPVLAGPMLGVASLASVPFFVAGGLKIAYDLTLWIQFRAVRPPEERDRTSLR